MPRTFCVYLQICSITTKTSRITLHLTLHYITSLYISLHYIRPEDLDVRVEGNSIVITAKQEIPEAGGVRTRVFEQKVSYISFHYMNNTLHHITSHYITSYYII